MWSLSAATARASRSKRRCRSAGRSRKHQDDYALRDTARQRGSGRIIRLGLRPRPPSALAYDRRHVHLLFPSPSPDPSGADRGHHRVRRPDPRPGAGRGRNGVLKEVNRTMLRLSVEATRPGGCRTPSSRRHRGDGRPRSEAFMTAATDFAKQAAQYDNVELPRRTPPAQVLKNALTMAAPSDPKEAAELAQLVASMEGKYGRGRLPGRRVGRGLPRHRRDHGDSREGPQPGAAARSLGRVAHDLAADEEELRAVRRALEQGRAGARLRRYRRDVAIKSTCRRTRSRKSSIGCGGSSGRSISRCTPTCGEAARRYGDAVPAEARFPRTCSATSGRRTGPTSMTSSAPRGRRADVADGHCCKAQSPVEMRGSASASSPRSASSRCRRRSGSGRCS